MPVAAPAAETGSAAAFRRPRLAVLLALQFAAWGVWSVPLGTYLTSRGWGDIVGYAYAMQGVAAVLSPLVTGLLADRLVAAQKLMGGLFLGAAACLFGLAAVPNRALFLAVVLVHFLCFVPTLPLANSVALSLIDHPKQRFPAVRAFGTLAWIGAGLYVGLTPGAAQSGVAMQLAAWACVFAGLYSFTLPAVPPPDTCGPVRLSALFGLDVLRHARDRNLRVFLAAVFAAVIPLAFYYAYGNVFLTMARAHLAVGPVEAGPTALQTVYQMAELLLLLPLPVLVRRAGTRRVVLLGLTTWILSYGVFAFAAQQGLAGVMVAATALQGISYSCLFTAGALYVDSVCRDEDCARAQSLFSTLSLGLGPVVGAILASLVFAGLRPAAGPGSPAWTLFWLVPAGLSAGVLAYVAARFRPERDKEAS